jgi:probable F420-dependent oxidoreductase
MPQYSRGRFSLRLGSQVKPHIERRFSMPWSRPAGRMREFIAAMSAVWSCWHEGAKLELQGNFYTQTLMTPFFSPDPDEFGPPPVFLAGVGEKMTELAGEVCDGFFFPPLTTQEYVRTVTLPVLARGRARARHQGLDGFTIAGPLFTCVGRDEGEFAEAIRGTKAQIAFYGSTQPTDASWTGAARVISNPSSPASPRKAGGRRWATPSTTRSSTR